MKFKKGDIVTHYKRPTEPCYIIHDTNTIDAFNQVEVVLYQNIHNGQFFTRPTEDFFGEVEWYGETVKRFDFPKDKEVPLKHNKVKKKDCPKCNGEGKIAYTKLSSFSLFYKDCDVCKGIGYVEESRDFTEEESEAYSDYKKKLFKPTGGNIIL